MFALLWKNRTFFLSLFPTLYTISPSTTDFFLAVLDVYVIVVSHLDKTLQSAAALKLSLASGQEQGELCGPARINHHLL